MSSVDEARLSALRERAAGASLLEALSPGLAWAAAAGDAATAVAAALAAEGHELDPAAHGDARGLLQRLDLAVLAHRQPTTLHVVAVAFDRIASASESLPAQASLRRRALEAWVLLAREGQYLRTLLGRIARDDEAAAVDALVWRRPFDVLRAWVADAEPALLTGHVRGAATLRVLRDLESGQGPLAERAHEARETLVDGLLAPLRTEDGERLAGRAPADERIAGFARWAELWQRTEHDTYLALCTLERLVDFGWELRSSSKYRELGQLYHPFRAMLEELVADAKRGGAAASYASLVGDAYVQLAAAETATAYRIAQSERALYVCPKHKLAESVLAFYLAQSGLEQLDAAGGIVPPALRTQLEGLIVRARQLDPTEARVQVLIDRYRAATGKAM